MPDGDAGAKLFIGGISWQTTEAGLREYFERYGALSDVALMRNKQTGLPRGFGFVKFKDSSAASAVLGRTHTIDGRTVDVKRAVPKDKGSPQGSGSSNGGSSSGGGSAGRSGGGSSSGSSRGTSGNSGGGSSKSSPSLGGSSGGGGGGGGSKGGGSSSGGGGSSTGGGSLKSTSGSKAGTGSRGGGVTATKQPVGGGQTTGAVAQPPTLDKEQQSRKIFVGGLAPSVSDMDFRVYFEKYGRISDAVVMFDRQTQRSRGFGFITFEAHGAVEEVFQDEPHELKGKTVEVKRAEPKEAKSAAENIASTRTEAPIPAPASAWAVAGAAELVASHGVVAPMVAGAVAPVPLPAHSPLPAAFAGLASALAGALPTVPLPPAVAATTPWPLAPPPGIGINPHMAMHDSTGLAHMAAMVVPDMEGQPVPGMPDHASIVGAQAVVWPGMGHMHAMPPGIPAPIGTPAGPAGMGMFVAPPPGAEIPGNPPFNPYGYPLFAPGLPLPHATEGMPPNQAWQQRGGGAPGRGGPKHDRQPREGPR